MTKKTKTSNAPSDAPKASNDRPNDAVIDTASGSRRRRPARISIEATAARSVGRSERANAPARASRAAQTDAPAPSKGRQRSVDGSSTRARRSREGASKRPSALDAAAQILAGLKGADAKEGITAPDLIERMSKAKLWTSPGGKTPAATLYAAMVREITAKGKASRFARVSPGRFASRGDRA